MLRWAQLLRRRKIRKYQQASPRAMRCWMTVAGEAKKAAGRAGLSSIEWTRRDDRVLYEHEEPGSQSREKNGKRQKKNYTCIKGPNVKPADSITSVSPRGVSSMFKCGWRTAVLVLNSTCLRPCAAESEAVPILRHFSRANVNHECRDCKKSKRNQILETAVELRGEFSTCNVAAKSLSRSNGSLFST